MKKKSSLVAGVVLLSIFLVGCINSSPNRSDTTSCPLGVVYFDSGSSAVNQNAREVIAHIAGSITTYGEIVIVGHSDATGTPKFNLKISQERARIVAKLLKREGVNNNLRVIGVGERNFIGNNISEETRKQSRRVEVVACS